MSCMIQALYYYEVSLAGGRPLVAFTTTLRVLLVCNSIIVTVRDWTA